MNLGAGRPRHNSDPQCALVPSLPTAIHSPSGLRSLRRAGAGTSETGKAAKELAGSRFPRGDTVPLAAKRPPPARPGSGRVLASPPPALPVQGQHERPQLFALASPSGPPPRALTASPPKGPVARRPAPSPGMEGNRRRRCPPTPAGSRGRADAPTGHPHPLHRISDLSPNFSEIPTPRVSRCPFTRSTPPSPTFPGPLRPTFEAV